ncbi:MAG TPA: enoyl-CoA hydratase/isomerase family protein [Gemmatimonadaceae bacterium]|nr:enoyl-CoA hydratase/isomerase family protein [Gemmatimonadaceae bacterium]
MDHILTERGAGILRITLNRPDKLNAFYGTMREDIASALREAEHDPSIRVVVITGAGRAFCAGGDVAYMHQMRTSGELADFSRILDAANAVVRLLWRHPKPTIAAVNGVAAGGGANLALACDIRVGTRASAFIQSFARIGLGPDWGGSFTLPHIVGTDRARELLLTARKVDSTEALQLGLLHQLVEPEQLMPAVNALASNLAHTSPWAVQAVKASVGRASLRELDSALEFERSAQIRCFLSDEARDAFKAFGARS